MSTIYNDDYKNASATLREVLDVYNISKTVYNAANTFISAPISSKASCLGALAASTLNLKGSTFKHQYPNICNHLIDGDSGFVASKHLVNLVSKYTALVKILTKERNALRTPSGVSSVKDYAYTLMRSAYLFIHSKAYLQYYPAQVYLPLKELYDDVDIFVSQLCNDGELFAFEPYIYEIDSPIASQFEEAFPDLYDLLSSADYPFTVEEAKTLTAEQAGILPNLVSEYLKKYPATECDASPLSLLNNLINAGR